MSYVYVVPRTTCKYMLKCIDNIWKAKLCLLMLLVSLPSMSAPMTEQHMGAVLVTRPSLMVLSVET